MSRPGVVVITGASAGVGRATARVFSRQGARIALLARGEAGLAQAAQEVEAAGGRALAVLADVADAWAIEAAAEQIERELCRRRGDLRRSGPSSIPRPPGRAD